MTPVWSFGFGCLRLPPFPPLLSAEPALVELDADDDEEDEEDDGEDTDDEDGESVMMLR
jgi:hypothetical protein